MNYIKFAANKVAMSDDRAQKGHAAPGDSKSFPEEVVQRHKCLHLVRTPSSGQVQTMALGQGTVEREVPVLPGPTHAALIGATRSMKGRTFHIAAARALPNAEHVTSVAPSIWRAKS